MFIEVTYQGRKYWINTFYIAQFTAVGPLTHLKLKDGSLMAVEEKSTDIAKAIEELFGVVG